MYIVFILQYQKVQTQVPNCLEIAEPSAVIAVFNGDLCEVRAYTVTISYCHSTWIRYQIHDTMTLMFILSSLLVLEIIQLQDKVTLYNNTKQIMTGS